MEIQDTKFSQFKTLSKKEEGIVLTDCGGEPQEWVDGVTKILNDEEIAKGSPDELWKSVHKLTTSGGRTDIAFISHNCLDGFNVGKMAMWRLRFGDCSWISDYLVNYAKQFTFLSNGEPHP